MTRLLEVRDLVTRFYTEDGTVHAVNGISYTLDEGESMGIVGESGSGKSVSVLSLMGLIPIPPGRIERGEAIFAGRDLLNISREELNVVTLAVDPTGRLIWARVRPATSSAASKMTWTSAAESAVTGSMPPSVPATGG